MSLNSIYKNWLKYAINYFKNKMNTKIEEALKVSEDILNYLNQALSMEEKIIATIIEQLVSRNMEYLYDLDRK